MFVSAAVPEEPAAEVTVVDVRVDGVRNVPLSKIVPQIHTRANRPFSDAIVQDDVRRLYATKMFDSVEPKHLTVPGGVVVCFRVSERPLIQYVRYVGNEEVGIGA